MWQRRVCWHLENIDEYVYKISQKLEGTDKDRQLTISKDSYGALIKNYNFANVPLPVNMFLKRTRQLLQSGLVPFWKRWTHRLKTWDAVSSFARNLRDAEFKAVSIGVNVQALFYFYLGLVLIPIIVLGLEYASYANVRVNWSLRWLSKSCKLGTLNAARFANASREINVLSRNFT